MGAIRTILHVDMDAFYASVEQLDHPELRGRPVLVGHDGARGVISAASYEARVFGCRSAQPTAMAKRRCPQAVIMPCRFERYHEISSKMFAILESFTPAIEPLSIDEAFMDCTGSLRLFGDGEKIARSIKTRVSAELQLTCSVGVAPNKFLAKLASDLKKPDGLVVIRADEIEKTLSPLPINKIWGIGPKTAKRLEDVGVRTIGDLKRHTPDFLQRRFGIEAERFLRLSVGDDARDVTPDSVSKSIGQERTFGEDLLDPDQVRDALLAQCEQIARRVRKACLLAAGVTVKIRDGDFNTVTRASTFETPTDRTDQFWKSARGLFDEWARKSFRPIRLIGVHARIASREDQQLPLFGEKDNVRRKLLDRAVDRIQDRFGSDAISRARRKRE